MGVILTGLAVMAGGQGGYAAFQAVTGIVDAATDTKLRASRIMLDCLHHMGLAALAIAEFITAIALIVYLWI